MLLFGGQNESSITLNLTVQRLQLEISAREGGWRQRDAFTCAGLTQTRLGSSLSITHLVEAASAKILHVPVDEKTPWLNLPYVTSISTQAVNALNNSNQMILYAATWPSNIEARKASMTLLGNTQCCNSLLLVVLHNLLLCLALNAQECDEPVYSLKSLVCRSSAHAYAMS